MSSMRSSRSCQRCSTRSSSTWRTMAAAAASCCCSSCSRPRRHSTMRCAARIAGALRTELSPRHVPDAIVAVPAIPRTLTAKKLELPVKQILAGDAAGGRRQPRRARPARRARCVRGLRGRARAVRGLALARRSTTRTALPSLRGIAPGSTSETVIRRPVCSRSSCREPCCQRLTVAHAIAPARTRR